MLIDTRMMLAFGGGHITGALNIGGSPMLSIWAGWLLDPKPILLVFRRDSEAREVVRLFIRTGYTKFAGYLVGGMKAWDNAGFPLDEVAQMTVHDIKKAGARCKSSTSARRTNGRAGTFRALNTSFFPNCARTRGSSKTKTDRRVLRQRLSREPGASILKQEGFEYVCNVPGSWQAWKKAKFPIEKNAAEEMTRRELLVVLPRRLWLSPP